MGLRPIKLRLDGEEVHLVPARDLQRWTGYLSARRAAYTLVTPDNVSAIRAALLTPPSTDTEGVFTELRKQLEDESALFFELPPEPVVFDAPDTIDLIDLLPRGGDEDADHDTPGGQPGLHWIEVVCVSPQGEGYAGARGRMRLPDGRTEFVTLDARSSVRFDDLTGGGTVHFELSGDASPSGMLGPDHGLRYELGASVGLSTRKRHVLVIHPNPNAFVSVELLLDGEPVHGGRYTLSTQAGAQPGELDGSLARAEGFALPSASTYAFEGVILPPRAVDEQLPDDPDADADEDEDERADDADADGGDDDAPPGPFAPVPTGPEHEPVRPDEVRVSLAFEDGTPVTATLRVTGGGVDREVRGDQASFQGVSGPIELHVRVDEVPA